LTNHGKTTSSAFLQLYSSISEAPDPYPLLEASVDALLLSEDTLPRVTLENEQLQKKVANLTSQLEAAEQRVAEERAARKELEDSRDSKLKEVEASWKAVIEEKRDNWEAKERSLEEKVESQDRLLKELKASFEVAQRLGHAENGDEYHQSSATAAELEIVSSDLDRTSQRLAEVEGRNEQLRMELAEALSNSQRTHASEEDPIVTRLRSDNSSLLRKVDSIRLEKNSEARRFEGRIRTLEKDVRMLESDREGLRQRLHSWRDYPDIKRELEIFKVGQVFQCTKLSLTTAVN
jgi:homeobox protein cut-like